MLNGYHYHNQKFPLKNQKQLLLFYRVVKSKTQKMKNNNIDKSYNMIT